MEKMKISVGETLELKSKLKKRSSYMYNMFNGKKINKIVNVNSLADARKMDETIESYFKADGSLKVVVVDGLFGEVFIPYSKLEKYIK